MDGSTDIAGDEQEAIFIRVMKKGVAEEHFLAIGSPQSTSSQDLYDFTRETFASENLDTACCNGVNKTGNNKGLAALYRHNLNNELINIQVALPTDWNFHSGMLLSHQMTLLIGLHYFYIKQYKNKHCLMESISALAIKGTLPPKVTGTRTFQAYEAHLSKLSHSNPKVEGLYKIMMDESLVCYTLSMKEIINPLMRLSCLKLLEACKGRTNSEVVQVKESGIYQGVALQGNCPSMSYVGTLIEGLASAIQCRFQETNEGVLNATKILDFSNWPDQRSFMSCNVNVDASF
ncbi:hypothetical protein MAR_027184, partial [Mya arenaria]